MKKLIRVTAVTLSSLGLCAAGIVGTTSWAGTAATAQATSSAAVNTSAIPKPTQKNSASFSLKAGVGGAQGRLIFDSRRVYIDNFRISGKTLVTMRAFTPKKQDGSSPTMVGRKTWKVTKTTKVKSQLLSTTSVRGGVGWVIIEVINLNHWYERTVVVNPLI